MLHQLRFTLIWVIPVLLGSTLFTLTSPVFGNTPSAFTFSSWEELCWQGVLPQTTSFNCGPTAAAMAVTLVDGRIITPSQLHADRQPASLASLQQALIGVGIASGGLHMTTDNLARYLTEQEHPAIAHILLPLPHFTLVTGYEAGHFITRDPSLGIVAYSSSQWSHLWSGKALLIAGSQASPTVPTQERYAPEIAVAERLKLLLRPLSLSSTLWR